MAWQPPHVGSRATWKRTFTADDVEAFARLSGDRNPLHFDEGFAARNGRPACIAAPTAVPPPVRLFPPPRSSFPRMPPPR